MIEVTLLGTGSPIPDPNRAGPSTLVRAGGQVFLMDCGRGVLQRAAAPRAGVGTLVMTHYVPAIAPGQEEQWRALAASEFSGQIELGDDLHRVDVRARQ
jgi:ribonuclease BN (tRNA processing enzyme)